MILDLLFTNIKFFNVQQVLDAFIFHTVVVIIMGLDKAESWSRRVHISGYFDQIHVGIISRRVQIS